MLHLSNLHQILNFFKKRMILIAYEGHLNREKLPLVIEMQWSRKQIFHNFLLHFWNLPQILMWLVKSLKCLVSKHSSTVKHCQNLHDRSFIILYNQHVTNWVENFSLRDNENLRKSFVNTLTADDKYSFFIGRIYPNQFKYNYLRNKKKIFSIFILHFWYAH